MRKFVGYNGATAGPAYSKILGKLRVEFYRLRNERRLTTLRKASVLMIKQGCKVDAALNVVNELMDNTTKSMYFCYSVWKRKKLNRSIYDHVAGLF